jgi:hypothetical protein
MRPLHVTASALIQAPADRVYAILADYRDGHPHVLPKPYFRSLEVEEGGVGAGTLIRCEMRLLGKTRTFRAAVTEPEPGRVLLETDEATGTATTFTVRPLETGEGTLVTIITELKTRGGLAGLLEGFLAKLLLRRIYVQELKLLEAFIRGGGRKISL